MLSFSLAGLRPCDKRGGGGFPALLLRLTPAGPGPAYVPTSPAMVVPTSPAMVAEIVATAARDALEGSVFYGPGGGDRRPAGPGPVNGASHRVSHRASHRVAATVGLGVQVRFMG